MRCREAVGAEFARRRRANPRYSLRRFARGLGVHHSSLSRLLRTAGPVTPRLTRALGRGLALAEDATDRMVGLEAAAAVAGAISAGGTPPGSRNIAVVTGIPLDQVNIALHALLRDGVLRMPSTTEWIITTGDHA